MQPDDLLRNLKMLLDETAPSEALAAFQGFKRAHSKEQHALLDAGFDLFIAGGLTIPDAKRVIVVALVHGIRTTAGWQEKARASLHLDGKVEVFPIGYGYFDVMRFIGPFRRAAIARVEQELRDLRRIHGDCELVVMAHSFGTYIVSKILHQSPDIRIERLLLCGSIIPTDYRWDQLTHNFNNKNCVNEVGTRDFWPVFARVASLGYGGSGSFGFKTVRVSDRFFDYGHSDFFTDAHLIEYWRPFILSGEVVKSPWDQKRPTSPWILAALGGVPWVKAILLAIITFFSFIVFWLFRYFFS